MEVTRYTIGVAFNFSNRETRRFDNYLKSVEGRLKKFYKKMENSLVFDLSRFNVDQKKLNLSLGNALDKASSQVVFEISRFSVNDRNLRATLLRAGRRNGMAAGANTQLSPSEWNRRTLMSAQIRREDYATRQAQRLELAQMRLGSVGRAAGFGGGIGGIASRAYGPALALGLGGYGLGALNRRNQQVVSAQLQTQATVQQFGGTAEQGNQSFQWLRKEADRIGFNYLDASSDYNKLTAGLMGSGFSLDQSQGVFKGFAELSRVNKLDKTNQNRLFRALSQVAGKDQLMSEELTGQIAEALPGGASIFAEAYRRQTGGDLGLNGSEDIKLLLKAMKDRNVKGDILTFAAEVAAERAAPGLSAAQKASQAEQNRFENRLSDTAIIASNAGVESGFARLFRTLTIALGEANPLVESLARGFDNTTKSVSELLLNVQSIQRFFQGRDSFIGDKLFPDEESQQKAFLFMENFKTTLTELDTLTDNIYNGWSQLLGLLESSPVLDRLNTTLSMLANGAATFNKLAAGDFSGAADTAKSLGQNYLNSITSVGRTGANAILNFGGFGINKALELGQYGLAGIDPRVTMDQITPYQISPYQIPAPFDKGQSQVDWETNYKAEQARMAANARNQYALPGVNQPLAAGQSSVDLKIDMNVNIDAANPEDFNQQFKDSFKSIVEESLLQYPQKE